MSLENPSDQPEHGDVYSSGSGEFIGALDLEYLAKLKTPKDFLHLQVLVNGEWYVYQLVAVEELGEKDAKPSGG